MHTLRWALCAVLVSPLALAAGRLSSSSSSGDLGLAPRPELARTIMLVPPHGAAAVVTAPEDAADRIRPRAAQLASVSTAPLHTAPLHTALLHTAPLRAGVRGRTFTRSTPTAQLAVYRVSSAPAPTRRPTTRRPTPQPAPAPTPKPKPVPPTPVPPQPVPAPTEPQAVTPAPPPVVVAPAAAPAQSAPAPTPADTRPGNGFGDGNHEHTGPPGQAKKQ